MIGWVRPQIADPGARRGAASRRARRARAPRSASARCCTCRNGDLVRLAPGGAGDHRRGAGRAPLQGRPLLVERRGAHRRRPPPARLRRHRVGRAGAQRAGRAGRRSRGRADRHSRDGRRRRGSMPRSPTTPCSRPSSRCRGRAGAIRTRSPRRSAARCARRSPRTGTRSRYATCTCSRCRAGVYREETVTRRTTLLLATPLLLWAPATHAPGLPQPPPSATRSSTWSGTSNPARARPTRQ